MTCGGFSPYFPGAIDRVSVFEASGKEIDAWKGTDPTSKSTASGISEIPLNVTFPIQKVKIYLNSPSIPGWNEIDAVELVGMDGDSQWAQRATASSSYGAPPGDPASIAAVEGLVPSWSGVNLQDDTTSTFSRILGETSAIDARGWPLAAMWCERDPATGAVTSGAFGSGRKPAIVQAVPSSQIQPPTYGSTIGISSASATVPPALPYRIYWPWFLIDSAFWGLLLSGLWFLITRPWKATVELSRIRAGRCIVCGYDIGYDFRAGCPECGWRREGC